jgi:glycosyltransferase involved in cell wall biosynthesis
MFPEWRPPARTSQPGRPLFSVVVPTFNRLACLGRCLDSLVAQTHQDFEVLVCDDGSTDGSHELARAFAGRLNLRYFQGEHWGGPARPRNVGVREAAGVWICFLDSDDWWYPDKLDATLPYLADFDVIFHQVEVATPAGMTGRLIGRDIVSPAFVDLMTRLNAIPNSGAMIRRDVIRRVSGLSEDSRLIGVEDFELWLRVSRHTERFFRVPQTLGVYWEAGAGHNLSASRAQLQNERHVFELYQTSLSPSDMQHARDNWNYRLEMMRHGLEAPGA